MNQTWNKSASKFRVANFALRIANASPQKKGNRCDWARVNQNRNKNKVPQEPPQGHPIEKRDTGSPQQLLFRVIAAVAVAARRRPRRRGQGKSAPVVAAAACWLYVRVKERNPLAWVWEATCVGKKDQIGNSARLIQLLGQKDGKLCKASAVWHAYAVSQRKHQGWLAMVRASREWSAPPHRTGPAPGTATAPTALSSSRATYPLAQILRLSREGKSNFLAPRK